MENKEQKVFNRMATQLSSLRLSWTDHEFIQKVLSSGLKELTPKVEKKKKS